MIETYSNSLPKGILYLLNPLFSLVRSEARFSAQLRTILFEELGVDFDVKLASVSVLPYGEDGSLLLEKEREISKRQAQQIASRICNLLQTEFLSVDMYFVSVRCVQIFGPTDLPIIEESVIKYFRRRRNTKVIVAKLSAISSVPTLQILKVLHDESKCYKYVCVEYDAEKNEVIHCSFSNQVSDRVALHLKKGGGTVVYE